MSIIRHLPGCRSRVVVYARNFAASFKAPVVPSSDHLRKIKLMDGFLADFLFPNVTDCWEANKSKMSVPMLEMR